MRLARTSLAAVRSAPRALQALQPFSTTTSARRASVVSLFGAEPMPGAPAPSATTAHASARAQAAAVDSERVAEERAVRIARRQTARDALARSKASGRFWTAARVETETEEKTLTVALDSRAVRHPATKEPLRLPARKRLLAHALALEWDQLTSVRQAGQGHRVPLMSLVCRALDLGGEEVEATAEVAARRATLVADLLRYLDTDSLLCWQDEGGEARELWVDNAPQQLTLHQLQERTATPILAFMRAHVWPGVRVEPVLGYAGAASTLLPRPHAPETRQAVQQWLEGLSGWDLAGVERATLAGKSLVVAARLVGGWRLPGQAPFTVEDAVAASNMEIAFQTALWGEVEDTHDVDAADMRRHFGSVILLVAE